MKLSIALGALAILNAVLALLMPWYVITRLGIGLETDSFFASGALPQFVFLVISYSVLQVLVPLLDTRDETEFSRDAWGFFLGVTAVFGLLALVLSIFSGTWVPLLVPGFSSQAKLLTISLTRVQLLAMIGNACVPVLWSVYYARQKFFWAEVSSIVANICALAFLVMTLPRFGIAAAAWTAVVNLGLKAALLMPGLGRFHWPHWKSYAMREGWGRAKPFLFSQLYARTDPLVDRFLTSMSSAGDLSLLYIGQQIYSVINLIVGKAISAPMVPKMANSAKAEDWRAFRRVYRERLLWIAALAILAFVALILGEPVLRLLIGRGGITEQNVRTLWLIMLALLGVFGGGAAGRVATAAFYAMGNARTPTALFVLTFTLYLPIKVLVFKQYGLIALALTISLHLVVNFFIQLFVLEKATVANEEAKLALMT